MDRTVPLPIQPFIYYFSQTITTLNLSSNKIDDHGVEHLANALQQNEVIWYAQHSRGKRQDPTYPVDYLGTPMKKKFGRSCVKTPYTPEKLGNTREYNGNELEQRKPKKSEKTSILGPISKNLSKFRSTLENSKSYIKSREASGSPWEYKKISKNL